jgi:hypothetical protein
MARRPPSEPPGEKEWTPESIRGAVRKIRRRLADVEAFEPQKVTKQFDPEVTALQISIRELLADVFGSNSRSYRSYQSAGELDTAGVNINGTPLHRVIEGLVHGKDRSITLLKSAIRFFDEKMLDDFPGEPLDQVALSAKTTIMSPGSPDIQIGAGNFAAARQKDNRADGGAIDPAILSNWDQPQPQQPQRPHLSCPVVQPNLRTLHPQTPATRQPLR